MKKLFWSLLLFLLAALPAQAAEQIDFYRIDATIQSDASVSFIETIDYNFGAESRHGIFRTIPTTKTNADNKKFSLEITDISVEDPFTTSRTGDEISIKIGDANRTITGTHRYTIRYTVSGALTYFPDHDELYWNMFGTNWEVPIVRGAAHVTIPGTTVDIQTKCFTGASGATGEDCTTTHQSGVVSTTLTKSLGAYEGMSVVIGFPKDLVALVDPKEVVPFQMTTAGKIALLIFGILAFGWYIAAPLAVIWYWVKHGRDPKAPMGVVSAWFSPPKNSALRDLTPVETGTLVDESADMRDIYGTLIDLARRGYIKIVERSKDKFSFTKMKEWKGDGGLQPFEQELLTGLIGDKETVKFEDTELAVTAKKVSDQVYTSLVADGFFPKNPQNVRNLFYVIAALAFITMNLPLTIIAGIFGRHMPRKTLFGAQSAAIAASLKNFLGSQEKHLAFQAKNQMFFEKLLPYAVAFGVEDIWAKRFADIPMTPPDWYQTRGTTFNSVVFAKSIGKSYGSGFTAGASHQSSTGFRSGFSSGGGFSGGGGGGGGGGSW
ncbi:hypothetical protein A2363_02735 [Candidatus Gottesmanbacteria bacterium RIFOXYB1_FULL_47_11]|uniref:DUF2207 domain-containing protein n=1 Tax=Candidatus Gottesmanbacteria bacterium RIFOXYB1_FULL_47_11 TaxID=1798401 RepID=A0A1F6BEF4_9BACT|nr:MAG: hypothetical protein A2363_02735 [Candidatus Gottesmanbacteria bacterium RIFOXYB1_FULL_47_11]